MQNDSKDRPPRFRTGLVKRADTWWLQKLKEHPLKAASISALAFGGVMLIMFFSYLQELPDLDLAGSASLLWALAVIGGTVMLFLIAISMLPGAHVKGELGTWRQSLTHIVLLSIPAVGVSIAWLLALTFAVPTETYAFVALLFVLCAATITIRYRQILTQAPAAGENTPSIPEVVADMSGGMAAWGLTLFLSFLFAIGLNSRGELDGWLLLLLIVVQVAFVYLMAIVAAKLDWSRQRPMLVVLAVAAIVIPTVLSRNPTAIGVAAVRYLGLGERPARLVVSDTGCDILNKAVGRIVCEVRSGEKTAVVCPAILKSRIGTPYFIELSPLGDNGKWPERRAHPLVPLAKTEVLS